MFFVVETKWIQLLFSIICIAHGTPQSYYSGSSANSGFPASRPSSSGYQGSSQSSNSGGYQQPSGGYQPSSGSANYPQSSGSGNYPQSSGSGNYPQSSGSGNYPQSSDSGNYPQSSGSENYPQSSGSSNRPQSSGSGNRPQSSNSVCKADAREPWSYEGRNGPGNWSSKYPTCRGRMQSPIAISSNYVILNSNLPKLAMNGYDIPISRGTIQNDGRTVTLTPEDKTRRTIFVNGSTYSLSEIHFHWGDTSNRGAEHTLDGQSHTMEVHFVHNSGKSKVAVVGSFFQEQNNNNSALRPIVDQLPRVSYKDQRTQLSSSLDLTQLLPENPASYYRYVGSLTTPGCDEGVIWSLLFNRILSIGNKQMEEFRKLFTVRRSEATQLAKSNCRLVNNFRPVQPLNRRQVFRSL